MPFSVTNVAILLLIIGNFATSLSDVAVKLLNGEISTFQYIFIRQLFSALVICPLWLKQSKQQRKLYSPKLHLFRAHLIVIGSGCMVVAITHLTLATANAVFYAAPLVMLPLSILLLSEKPTIQRSASTLLGFIGVIVVLRPSEFQWAAIFALATTLTLALFNITARKLPEQQTVVSTLFWTSLLSLPVSASLAFFYWTPISTIHLLLILASAALVLTYNGLVVTAYQRAPASSIAVAENSGLVFVTLFGVIWFDEVPDILTVLGIFMIILPLLPWKSLLKLRLCSNQSSERQKSIIE
ncbi:DMT family transporter [Shewanella sp. FJAT-51649]|uniref:DMT family transporter n=2 Tax=Shewanellaceae TaxID=267890 RepID=UPI000B4A2B10|nr:DMT family transporter [Shewanella sp. FJAT-51649]QYJ73519.1 DMT family transporter [Shewanella sp. FJAT-51649]